ncbi:HCLS1-binding protein 3 isoform X2 [Fukomys damarensis]|uniref:HCLS1-binding protein 3 isoform X2 n=1 Tax=Fukomys damarensis TaxID=885580 RepID=UPI0008FEB8D8|nr:HCLS1-binding protein 3 isoform X2 [Fukomys damarensis]
MLGPTRTAWAVAGAAERAEAGAACTGEAQPGPKSCQDLSPLELSRAGAARLIHCLSAQPCEEALMPLFLLLCWPAPGWLRQLQNVHTGLDLSVPQHQEVRGKMLSGHVEYQILVVTRLAAFKSAKHKPEDAVQFLVSKKYSEIEELYQKLSSRYAAASLPPLPRKVLFVGESDIRERRAMFSEILRCVAKDVQLAGSPELLEFLGTRSPGATGLPSRDSSASDDTGGQAGDSEEAFNFFEQQDHVASVGLPVLGQKSESGEKSLEEEEEEEEEEALDPLGILRSKKPKQCPKVAVKAKPAPQLTIFDEEEDPDGELFGPGRKLSPMSPSKGAPPVGTLKLFDDPDLGGAVPLGDPLLLPAACGHGGLTSSLDHRGASHELFRVGTEAPAWSFKEGPTQEGRVHTQEA